MYSAAQSGQSSAHAESGKVLANCEHTEAYGSMLFRQFLNDSKGEWGCARGITPSLPD
jgi:hypothetical protein